MGLLLMPSNVWSKKYHRDRHSSSEIPMRTPEYFCVDVIENTGDMYLTPYDAITGLNITLTGSGVTYINTTVSLNAGQSFTDCLDYLSEGTYILTLSTIDGVIDQYEITVEDD